ncbi:MAG: helix-turn-helix domain-containing protein, partial [Anaerorhabdus sp.]
IFYERVKQYDLFSHFTPNQLTYYCNQKLYSLYLHEKNEKTEYIKTLRIYLECNHSVKDTAELLFIHRNTVNYRIQKIKELLDMEISDQSLTNELLFSCQILQILDHN